MFHFFQCPSCGDGFFGIDEEHSKFGFHCQLHHMLIICTVLWMAPLLEENAVFIDRKEYLPILLHVLDLLRYDAFL